MVIDDEEFCITAVKQMLSIIGISIENQVDFCFCGQDAVDKLIERYDNGMQFKLILTDYKMPIMDGVQVTKKVRAHLKDVLKIPVRNQPTIIGVTGHVSEQYKRKFLSAGMDEILPKPLYIKEFKKKLIHLKLIDD